MDRKEIRVLQLIDSLDIGGAERMSVNIANVLAENGYKSYLCATRKGGALESAIDKRVTYMVLGRKSSLDIAALYRLVVWIRKNRIDIVHAHSTSFVTAVLCKTFTGVKIVWHDHNGARDKVQALHNNILSILSYFFDTTISVNEKLRLWAKKHLNVKHEKIVFLQNFAQLPPKDEEPQLPGTKETRIVCLANLREQKDHMTLLSAFSKVIERYPEWHLLLVGADRDDEYSRKLKSYVMKNGMLDNVHFLGSRSDSGDILRHCTIGVLSSESEGLPVALLEYGLAGLAVVCTDVGECREVLGNGSLGKLIPSGDSKALASALEELISDESLKNQLMQKFHDHIEMHYSKRTFFIELDKIYRDLNHAG